MGSDDDQPIAKISGRRRRKGVLVWLLLFALLALFHRPILFNIIQKAARHYAAKENLRADFRLEGTLFTGLIVRNLHVVAMGPSGVESIDADFIRADYSLISLASHGLADFIENLEVRSASIVLDPSKAPPPKLPKAKKKPRLFGLFPKQVQLAGVNVRVRDRPKDFLMTNLSLSLYPDREGRLTIRELHIPKVHAWSDITAATSYKDRNLFLRDVVLDQQTQFRVVNVDASKIDSKILSGAADGVLASGSLSGSVKLEQTRKSLAIGMQFQARDISLDALGKYLGRPDQLTGDVRQINVDWHGVLNVPKTWNGSVAAWVENVRRDKMGIDAASVELTAARGTAIVRDALVVAGENRVQSTGRVELPSSIEAFGRTPGNLLLKVSAPNLEQLTGFLQKPITGSLQVEGSINIKDAIVTANLRSTGERLGFENATLEKLSATIEASKKMPPPKLAQPYYANLKSTIHADLINLRYDQHLIDDLRADLRSDGNSVALEQAVVVRKLNRLTAAGKIQLPPPNERLSDQPGEIEFTLQAPELVDYWPSDDPARVTGSLQGNGQISFREGLASGQIALFGADIRAKELLIRQFTTEATIARNVVYLNDLRATLNEKDYVGAHGTIALRKPFPYSGGLIADVQNLSTFEPLLRALGNSGPLAGSLNVTWEGNGDAATFKNTGQLKVNLEKGRFANLMRLQAKVEASYTPDGLNAPIIYLQSDKTEFHATMETKGPRLEINQIQVNQAKAKYANGYISLPFNWKNLGTGKPLFASDGKVNVNIQSENLDLKKLFGDLGMKLPVLGEANVKMDAQGTLDELAATLDLRMTGLRSEKFPQLQPATFDLGARIQNSELVVSGKLQQARVEPVQIDAHFPFNISKIIEARKLDENTPVVASVRMPRSPVNFVREFVPALRTVDGSLALDAKVGGTIAKPALSGTADMNINLLRLENPTLPALTNFKALVNFRGDTISFDRFGGDLAGGPFTLSGKVTLPKLTAANLDLRLQAKSVLVARNNNVTARVDADLKIEGPLKSATVSGNVATTNSQFLKNIDIIPIGLPGRPAPRPTESAPRLSFSTPPLRDWKFDVVIKSKDPFLIRGNLANGTAIIDTKVTGTGLHPVVQGQVRLKNFEATLPFSTLTIEYGFLYFDPDDPLDPRIELHGTSLLRDYTIHVFVYGTARSPEAVFNSEPPLPQEEIISLLATGVTRGELKGTNNMIAGRAAFVLAKQLYRKIFKKDAGPENDSVFNRLDVEFGNVDPRTGQQTATARFRVNKNVVLIGDVGVGGDFRGLVKYVIRFR